MENFKNTAENFFREIRKIEIYNSDSVSYQDNFNGVFLNANLILYAFDVKPEDFSRNIPRKKRNGNYYHEIDLGFPLLKIDATNVEKYQSYFNQQKFAVVLVSNTEKTLLGNKLHPLTIEVLDNKKDDNSGTDEYNLSITGEAIITPKVQNL